MATRACGRTAFAADAVVGDRGIAKALVGLWRLTNGANFDRLIQRLAARPRARRHARRELVGLVGILHVDDPEAGDELLRLRERAICDNGTTISVGLDEPRLIRR